MQVLDLKPLFEALGPDAQLHAVGGWVRDRLQRKWLSEVGVPDLLADAAIPEGDLDLATALHPETVLSRAKQHGLRAIPTGIQHGTVTVVLFRAGEASCDGTRKDLTIEITTFRSDGKYTDGRRPDSVRLGVTLAEDLSRRDFTFNALALPIEAMDNPGWESRLIDPHGGVQDLKSGVIRAVGDPVQRFSEDGLRSLRACRFASQLGKVPEDPTTGANRRNWPAFELDLPTFQAIGKTLDVSRKVAVERVFTESTKLLAGSHPEQGMTLLESSGLLDLWLPEMRPMVGCEQNEHHRFDVWGHTLECLRHSGSIDAGFNWALLLHDIGKPVRRTIGKNGQFQFLGHEEDSTRMARAILSRFKAPHRLVERVTAFIELHGRHPELGKWTAKAYRKLLRDLESHGLSVEEWSVFRRSDKLGQGWGTEGKNGKAGEAWMKETREEWAAIAEKLEEYRYEGMTPQTLGLNGNQLISIAKRPPGPWIGKLQKMLLESVLEDPGQNSPERLETLVRAWLASEEGRS